MAKAIRDAYGEALAAYGAHDPRVVVLDADVSSSTKSAVFEAACPERFFNVGIAEANMTAMAAGLAAVGKIPFVNTFAVFLTSIGLAPARLYGSYAGLPIKLAGAYGGLSDSFDGPSHHSLEDLAVMRALPNFKVFVASDEVQTAWLVKNAIETPSPMYLRLSREVFPRIYSWDESFKEGEGKVLREGTDAAVLACGLMAANALQAAERLEKEGISLRVVDMFSIKPLDEELVVRCAKETGALITAEEHGMYGGLGSAVCEALCKAAVQVPVGFAAIPDIHTECGSYQQLQAKYSLDADGIIRVVRDTLQKKRCAEQAVS